MLSANVPDGRAERALYAYVYELNNEPSTTARVAMPYFLALVELDTDFSSSTGAGYRFI